MRASCDHRGRGGRFGGVGGRQVATIRFHDHAGYGMDMRYNDFFYGWNTHFTRSVIRQSDGEFAITFRGAFTSNGVDVFGRIDSIAETRFGVTLYEATGLGKNAHTIWTAALAGNNAGAMAYLTSGHDTIVGTRYGDFLSGNAGNDVLHGRGGNDALSGGAGNDRLSGGAGADRLSGGAGADRLAGDAGRDVLTGGSGSDTFIFRAKGDSSAGAARDRITDFSRAEGDRIDLSAFDANDRVAGVQDFAFVGARAFSGKAGELRLANGILAADTNGDRIADFEVAVNAPLGAGDLIL